MLFVYVSGDLRYGLGLNAPAHPSATIFWPCITCCFSLSFSFIFLCIIFFHLFPKALAILFYSHWQIFLFLLLLFFVFHSVIFFLFLSFIFHSLKLFFFFLLKLFLILCLIFHSLKLSQFLFPLSFFIFHLHSVSLNPHLFVFIS